MTEENQPDTPDQEFDAVTDLRNWSAGTRQSPARLITLYPNQQM
ncbi:hypothetical protein Cylst_6504 (plasmid) [Cylindrospermum stagnale PCC 7417]|uniref:Uncharacterized protein n=1 Tax=Cylindrospermum stagnale PCC 7417 TaxID=56107 RepID=K9X6K5_9NOST|nr:hypothetical protein [Cylindrospermum stagnale]AFZ28285.1 hypothetical protein Cylst_6504 [Cylindrospermum stagnale PCC 7417]